MSKLDIILGITAAISLAVTFKIYAENQKMRKESKKHKCVVGTTFCNDMCCYYCEGNHKCKTYCKGDPLTCGNAREE